MTNDQIPLHDPRRTGCFLELEDHLISTANLTRSIWLILQISEFDMNDSRNLDAISELANMAADHATAARFCYLNQKNIEDLDKIATQEIDQSQTI